MSAPKKSSGTVHIDRTPAHHKLQPGDWFQFLTNGPLYKASGDHMTLSEEVEAVPFEVGDTLVWQFQDEPGKRQFRILAIPVEGVYECAYISRC